jgi:hypothetical protein
MMLPLALGLSSCRGATSREAPIVGIRNMYDQPRYNMQAESDFFEDKRTMRPLVEGVVAREQILDDKIARGRLDDDSGYVLTIPREAVDHFGGMDKMLARGRDRFDVYCAPCHDRSGSGEGMIKKRAMAAGATAFVPTSLHITRLRQAPDGQIFATIANGKGNMPPYAFQLPPADRWAVVAYVRALQLSQPKVETKP